MITAYFVSRMMSQEPNFSESRCFSQGVGCLFRCPTIVMPPVDSKAKPFVLCNQDRYDVTISTTEKKTAGRKKSWCQNEHNSVWREAYPLKIALSSWCDFLSLYRDFSFTNAIRKCLVLKLPAIPSCTGLNACVRQWYLHFLESSSEWYVDMMRFSHIGSPEIQVGDFCELKGLVSKQMIC